VPGGETKQLPPKERINVFASHLKYILDLAQKYPDCFLLEIMILFWKMD